MDDLERARLSRDARRFLPVVPPPGGTPQALVTRFGTPTAGQFFRASPVFVTGDESEGAIADLTDSGGGSILVYPIGTASGIGEFTLASRVANRWATGEGRSSPPPSCTLTVEANGHCLKGDAGAAVTVTKGAGTWLGTTNAWGYAGITLTGGAGTYTVHVVGAVVNDTKTVAVDCATNPYPFISFDAPAWPSSFPASDGFGSFSVTGVGSPAGYAFAATRSIPYASILQNCDPYTFDACHPTYAAGNFCVNYTFGCSNPTGARNGPLVMAMGISWVGTAFNQFVPFAGGFGGIPGICTTISDAPPACCWSGGSGAVPLTVTAAGCGPSAGPTTTSCKNVTRIANDTIADSNTPIFTFSFAPGPGINGPITVG